MEEIKVVEAVDQEVVDVVEEGTMEQETLEPMTEEEFKDFVNGEVLDFLEEFGLKMKTLTKLQSLAIKK